ncbi:MAG: hypothetical protein IPF74_15895 [Rhodocyclaceae bacterium]|nr:hypothetical protein [Rhodocyclaceae bacterium]
MRSVFSHSCVVRASSMTSPSRRRLTPDTSSSHALATVVTEAQSTDNPMP